LTGSSSKLESRPLPIDDPIQRCPDITRAREYFGWKPRVSLDKGLREPIAYFERTAGQSAPAPITDVVDG